MAKKAGPVYITLYTEEIGLSSRCLICPYLLVFSLLFGNSLSSFHSFKMANSVISPTTPIIFEKMVCDKLTPIISPRISDTQHGFLKGCSTVTILIEFKKDC
jgi:hypothetical protein